MNTAALQREELTVIAAAILGGTSLFGGTGSVLETVAGAPVLYTLTNGFKVALMANWFGFAALAESWAESRIRAVWRSRRCRWDPAGAAFP